MLLTKLTANNVPQETLDALEALKKDVEEKYLAALKAKEEFDKKLHEFQMQETNYNYAVKNLNRCYDK